MQFNKDAEANRSQRNINKTHANTLKYKILELLFAKSNSESEYSQNLFEEKDMFKIGEMRNYIV